MYDIKTRSCEHGEKGRERDRQREREAVRKDLAVCFYSDNKADKSLKTFTSQNNKTKATIQSLWPAITTLA